jgi:hypothetical protein
MLFLRRREGVDPTAFQQALSGAAREIRGEGTYVLNLPELLSTTRFGAGEVDAVVELALADVDADVARASARAERGLQALASVVDAHVSSWAVLEERVVFPPGAQGGAAAPTA